MSTMLFSRDNDAGSGSKHYVEYPYQPSMAAAAIFIVLFGISSLALLFRMVRSRTWFMVPFFVATLFETVGYVARAISASQNPGPYTKDPYIIQTVLILVAPAFMAASVYMQLGRIVVMCGADRLLLLRRTWLTKIFVGGDIASFLLQAGGAGLLASSTTTSGFNAGSDIIVGGLFTQVVSFGIFVATAITFNVKLRHCPTEKSKLVAWERQMHCLYAVSALILVRSIVRVVEYIQGHAGYISTHEVFLYVFDATVMFIAVTIQIVIYPAVINQKLGDDEEMLPK